MVPIDYGLLFTQLPLPTLLHFLGLLWTQTDTLTFPDWHLPLLKFPDFIFQLLYPLAQLEDDARALGCHFMYPFHFLLLANQIILFLIQFFLALDELINKFFCFDLFFAVIFVGSDDPAADLDGTFLHDFKLVLRGKAFCPDLVNIVIRTSSFFFEIEETLESNYP